MAVHNTLSRQRLARIMALKYSGTEMDVNEEVHRNATGNLIMVKQNHY
jgi:hypothetical protein